MLKNSLRVQLCLYWIALMGLQSRSGITPICMQSDAAMLADICSTALASQRRWGQLRGKFSSYWTVYECKVILQRKVQSVLSNVVLLRFMRSESPWASGNNSSMFHTAEPSSYPTRVCLSHCLLVLPLAYAVPWSLPKHFLADCQLAQVKPCQETQQQLKTIWDTYRRVLKAMSRAARVSWCRL